MKWCRMVKPLAISTTFLTMYCPVSVSTQDCCHVAAGRKPRGKKVAHIWRINRPKAHFVNFGINQKIPIAHSKTPKKIRKLLISINCEMVTAWRLLTRVSAGEICMILRKPNQKKTRDKAILLNQTTLFSNELEVSIVAAVLESDDIAYVFWFKATWLHTA